MSDQTTDIAQGETHGSEQEPIRVGERDATQREQAQREGATPLSDPAQPDARGEDRLMARSPDRAYGQREDSAAAEGTATGPVDPRDSAGKDDT